MVQKAFRGVEGCITIHNNVLFHGATKEEHNRNLSATLERAREMGVTFKLSKSTFCQREVRWFGRVFSQTGVLADPDKITKMVTAGRPESLEDVSSFLQAASYNVRFTFKEGKTYKEATALLKELLGEYKVFE